ncbi:MAG TPA: dihydroorotase [Verrucomicrobiales bacterium]|nr:dihydroorotase [Verrucomicrobiales bacterium]
MSSSLITGGRLIDPSCGRDEITDVLILDGKVAVIGPAVADSVPEGVERIDASGLVVCPGLIDIHVHFREPGQTENETIKTGAAAAMRGGFTTVVCMPNTSPVIDTPGTVVLIQEKAAKEAKIDVLLTGAITKGIEGKELAPIGSLKQAGVVAITDDGRCVQDNEIMRRALEYAGMFDLPIMDHCQDYSAVTDGVIHEGYWSSVLGLDGWPAVGEELIVSRNILLAELTGTPIHCQHISAAGSVRLIREAKTRGIPISGEACPHHFTLTDAAIAGSEAFWKEDGGSLFKKAGIDCPQLPEWPAFHTHFKMNPPLRSLSDRQTVLEGVLDGTLEILSSDHAPHCGYQKDVEFSVAPFGITGLETELALSLMQLHHSHGMELIELIRRFTITPAKLLHLEGKGSLQVGMKGDVTLFDPDEQWVYTVDQSDSMSTNSPFLGWPLKGRNRRTIHSGRTVWSHNSD